MKRSCTSCRTIVCYAVALAVGAAFAPASRGGAQVPGGPAAATANLQGFALVPIGASGPHGLDDRTIYIAEGNQQVTFEVRAGGWDPDLDGYPKLRTLQAQVDSAGFTSGAAGGLSLAEILIPCANDADCPMYNVACVEGLCEANAAFFVDESHADYVFSGLEGLSAVNTINPSPIAGATLFNESDAVTDPGVPRYLATVVLDVSSDAAGTFTVGFNPDPFETFMAATDSTPISIATFLPATVVIGAFCDGSNEGEPDCNGNGLIDACDVLDGTSPDCNGNGRPDECETDCNANGIPDDCDIAGGTSVDCDANGVPDECETGGGSASDCNGNGALDTCDIAGGFSADCNDNGVPDECDLDTGSSNDCNGNAIPDECEMRDCNGNGIVDACDIASGVLTDADGDGRPDECEVLYGFALVPVGASGPHVIRNRTVILGEGGQQVSLEIRAGGWDPDLDGYPKLRTLQAQVDSAGFTSGSTGSLSVAEIPIPCANDADCPMYNVACVDGLCEANGAFFVDETHANYVFSGLEDISAVNTINPSPIAGATLFNESDAVTDTGVPRYLASMVLDVSVDAAGSFTVGFNPDPAWTFMSAADVSYINFEMLLPATVEVGTSCGADVAGEPDCNDNGNLDLCDVLDGASEDCNGNLTPDECEDDCNGNGLADECDIADGTSEDCAGNGIPDECERGGGTITDCNANGVPDDCDIAYGNSADCNANGSPDECDMADGTSADCNANNVPDDCELTDCNGNGQLDSCDLAIGILTDVNGDGVPDECEPLHGFALVPIGATGTHVTRNRTIYLGQGDQRVTFELRAGGWNPNLDGSPKLRTLQAQVDSAGFSSGAAGSLSLAEIPVPCGSHADCPMYGVSCVDGLCEANGAFFVDETHPNYAFSGLEAISAVNTINPSPIAGATLLFGADSVLDTGDPRYLATMVLDVSADAAGTFAVGINPDPGQTFMVAQDNELIPAEEWLSATVAIGMPCGADLPGEPDCNGNGKVDLCEVLDGDAADENGNDVPDECDIAPAVTAEGSRFLRTVMSSHVAGGAMIVVQCPGGAERFAMAPSGETPNVALLTDQGAEAAMLTPAEWKSPLHVTGIAVAPHRDYLVCVELEDGTRSAPVYVSTGGWADIAGADGANQPDGVTDFRDITAVVRCFLDDPGAPALAQCDLDPELPDGVIDFHDIAASVRAFLTGEYPYETTIDCPGK